MSLHFNIDSRNVSANGFMDWIDRELSGHRPAAMGVSILAVLLYHLYCFPKPNPWLACFRNLYIGVDFFFFLSGYGLCRSYAGHSIPTFYARRLARLLPQYAAMVIMMAPISVLKGRQLSIYDVICSATTLNYYGLGAWRFGNWFVASMLFFCLIFPLLYLGARRLGPVLLVILCGASLTIVAKFNLPWEYDCFVSRIPIFAFGILFHEFRGKLRDTALCLAVTSIFLAFALYIGASRFFVSAMLAPLLLPVLALIASIPGHIQSFFSLNGRFSYELFMGNHFTAVTIAWLFPAVFPLRIHWLVPIYSVCTVAYGTLFALIGKIKWGKNFR